MNLQLDLKMKSNLQMKMKMKSNLEMNKYLEMKMNLEMNSGNELQKNCGNELRRQIMSFNIDYNDLVRILKNTYGYGEFTAKVVADYLDECVDYELDLTHYVWNTLPYDVSIFETKEEALRYVSDENLSSNDYTLYECSEGLEGVYLEVY